MKLRGALFAALLSSANALRSHCADSNGEFVGLVGDHHYAVESAPNGDAWTSTQDDGTFHSFTGTFLQVLPDDGDSHAPDESDADPFAEMASVRFAITVESAGIHTLSVRWTGGDTVGGGDSLYAVMRQRVGAGDGRGAIVGGVLTYKPEQVGIVAPTNEDYSWTIVVPLGA